MKWFLKCIGRDYVTFSGRARRAEYWYFTLFAVILLMIAATLDAICFGEINKWFYGMTGLFLLLPSIAVLIRRLHDIGRSGVIVVWYYVATIVWSFVSVAVLIASIGGPTTGFLVLLMGGILVFLVWSVVFLVWCCTPGTPGPNEYGPDPKAVEE